jgi:hypothetical protein
MRDPLTTPVEAYAPATDRAGPDASAPSPEWLVRWLALLIFFLTEPLSALRVLCSGRLPLLWRDDRPDLPAGSAQSEARVDPRLVRHRDRLDVPPPRYRARASGVAELSRAIMAFGGSLAGYRFDAPPCGLQWWENPNIVPGMGAGFSAPAAATASLTQLQDAASAPTPPPNAMQAEASHARLPASWLPASWLPATARHVFARAGPGPPPGPPGLPETANTIASDARGRSMASLAILIRANR